MANSKYIFYKIYTSETEFVLKKKNKSTLKETIITEEDKDYKEFISKGGEVEVVEYIPPKNDNEEKPIIEIDEDAPDDINNEDVIVDGGNTPKLPSDNILNEELINAKKAKLVEIKEAWKQAENIENCNTNLKCLDDHELVIQYSTYDREIWNKKVIGFVMEMLKKGEFEIISNDYTPLYNTMQITQLEAVDISIGHIPARVYLIIKDCKTNVRDAFNNFHEVTIETMLKASIAQNLKVEQDLYKKWLLEKKVFEAANIEEVNLIHW